MSELSASLGTKLDKADVVDPGAEAEAGQAADAKSTYEGLNRVLGVASDARVLAESKADRATTLSGYGITDAATKTEIAAKADLVDGKVPAAQLPSYVDDVLEYDTMSDFPATGEGSKIYVAKDTNLVYRWSGTQYVEISPSPAFDNTVTETSQNGVKSSGIWSWVKSLLPHWLTSDYAEPATVASVADKRDMSDLAVYSVTRTENTDWTWESENKELEAALNAAGSKAGFSNERWETVIPSPLGFLLYDYGEGDGKEALTVSFPFKIDDPLRLEVYTATATRPRYMDESIEQKADQQLAAVATDDAAKPADGSLMKYDAANDRFVKAIAGSDYRDPKDNTCHKTEFGDKWTFSGSGVESGAGYSVLEVAEGDPEAPTDYSYYLSKNGVRISACYAYSERPARVVDFSRADVDPIDITATRSAVCTSNELYTTTGYVDGKVSSAVSTNNPAFVSAVQNTPAPEPGQGEDPPWGTWGTVGAAIAGLVEGLEWIKSILGSVASGYSTFAEWIASKYTKPSGGIPASDLALTVQSSLDAADAAAPQATTYTKDETDAAIRAGASLGQMTNLGNGRYEYTGALADASTQTYPREEA